MTRKFDPYLVLWPTKENYARFKSLPGNDVPETLEEYQARYAGTIDGCERAGIPVRYLAFDPDGLWRYCLRYHGTVDDHAKGDYARHLFDRPPAMENVAVSGAMAQAAKPRATWFFWWTVVLLGVVGVLALWARLSS